MADADGRVIAVANMKGGVGKTTTVVMLAEGLAEAGHRVVVLDLDAQANASYCFAPDEQLKTILEQRRSVTSFLADRLLYGERAPITDYLAQDISHVMKAGVPLAIDMVVASPRLRLLEREIVLRLTEKNFGIRSLEGQSLKVLQEALALLRARYDYVLFDCAPGISAFTEVAIRLSDMVVVPTIPDYLSTLGFDAFRASVWENAHVTRSTLPQPKRRPVVLASRVNANKIQHRETLASLREEAAAPDAVFEMFDLEVDNQAAIERAMDPENFPYAPTFEQKWNRALDQVRDLVSETRRRLDE
ncbi:ParA family protein [Xanthobacter autotrophicus]|uniref:ParA family protein n=1 Tax=Xanthobacter autotrophicus TaxID=280 RepID=UPI00372AF2D4